MNKGNNRPLIAFGRAQKIWSIICAVIAALTTAYFTDRLPPPDDGMAIPYGLMLAAGIWLTGMIVLVIAGPRDPQDRE